MSYNSPSGTKLRTPKLPVGKLCRDIYVHMVPFGSWLPLLKFDWRLLTKNDESRANRLTRASLLTSFWRETIAFASKRNPSPCPQSRQKHPRHSRDAFEVQSSTPLGVQPCVLTKTTMSNALAAPTALGATPSTVRSDTSDLFNGETGAAFCRCAMGARGAQPRAPPSGPFSPLHPFARIVPRPMLRPTSFFRRNDTRATAGARPSGLLPGPDVSTSPQLAHWTLPRSPTSLANASR